MFTFKTCIMNQPAGRSTCCQSKARYSLSIFRKISPYNLPDRPVVHGALWQHYTKFGLLQCREEYRQNPPARLDNQQKGVLEGDFGSAMSLYHGFDLLQQHGLRPFYNFMLRTAGEMPKSPGSPSGSTSFSPGNCIVQTNSNTDKWPTWYARALCHMY